MGKKLCVCYNNYTALAMQIAIQLHYDNIAIVIQQDWADKQDDIKVTNCKNHIANVIVQLVAIATSFNINEV